jgi:hypothetical protein
MFLYPFIRLKQIFDVNSKYMDSEHKNPVPKANSTFMHIKKWHYCAK